MKRLLEVDLVLPRTWVSGFSIFRTYCAVKAHMSGKYDISKYKLAMKTRESAYEKRSDKVFFERLAKRHTLNDCYQLLVSNLAANPNAISYEIAGADAHEFWLKHTGFLEIYSQHYKSELLTLFTLINSENKKFKDLFRGEGHPVIMQLVLRGTISIETFVILNRLLNFVPVIDKDYGDDIFWFEFKTRALAYDKLLKIDDKLAKEMFILVKNQVK
ncbi:helicase assembly protein [Vibrio phage 1.081.O._10N.286.52.C2]|nr:helicase assembly protein [Vibrio phage 1.081.O._10N.286.52.C2]